MAVDAFSPVVAYHRCDPFSRVHGSMPDYAFLGSFTTATPDMNTFNVSTFDRLASRDYFSILGECCCKICDPLHMVGNGVIRVEPSSIWRKTG
jgi:hypothetical protein